MRFISQRASLLGAAALLLAATPAQAQIGWNWSFGGSYGQFITAGTTNGGVVAPGTYLLSDFLVYGSDEGASLGSWGAGQYVAAGFGSTVPYNLTWIGSSAFFWSAAGTNTFNWWVFADQVNDGLFLFGWETGNFNTFDQAAYYTGGGTQSHQLSLQVGEVPQYLRPSEELQLLSIEFIEEPGEEFETVTTPEPATMSLLALGLVGLALAGRRRRSPQG